MSDREIVLVRHGRPASENNDRLSSSGFARWVKNYNRCDLHPESQPHCQRDFSNHYSISSALQRAKLSAQRYTGQPVTESDAVFNEMDIPRYRLPFKLNAWTWVYLNRAMWIAGRRGPFESFSQARRRIEKACDLLVERAANHHNVVLFAHAMTNRFLCRYLVRRGWQIIEKDHRYWGVIVLRKPACRD